MNDPDDDVCENAFADYIGFAAFLILTLLFMVAVAVLAEAIGVNK